MDDGADVGRSLRVIDGLGDDEEVVLVDDEKLGEECWLPDPDHLGQERFWDGYEWTDQVRPDDSGVKRFRVPEHVPELQRALAAAATDIDVFEDRLSLLFNRTVGRPLDRAGPRSLTTLVPPPRGR